MVTRTPGVKDDSGAYELIKALEDGPKTVRELLEACPDHPAHSSLDPAGYIRYTLSGVSKRGLVRKSRLLDSPAVLWSLVPQEEQLATLELEVDFSEAGAGRDGDWAMAEMAGVLNGVGLVIKKQHVGFEPDSFGKCKLWFQVEWSSLENAMQGGDTVTIPTEWNRGQYALQLEMKR